MARGLIESRGARALFLAACLVVVVAGLKLAAPVLLPVALAFFVATLNLPLLAALKRRRVPAWLGIVLVVGVNASVIGLLVLIVSESLTELRYALPWYVARTQEMIASGIASLQARGVPISDEMTSGLIDAQGVLDLAGRTLRGAAALVSRAFLILLITIFILAEATVFPAKFRRAFGHRDDADLTRYTRIIDEVQQYLAIKTAISLATGILVGLWAWVLGVDFALFWGLLAFLLNYVPNIGSILAALPAIMLALLQFGPGRALLVGLGYLVVNMVLGNFLEPSLQGRRLGLSTLVVILSLVFWGWVWGPVGMLLSVPLTVIVRILLENTPDLQWVAVLLGNPAPDELERPLEGPLGPGDVTAPEPATGFDVVT
jgi:predicted PurR-regulated permease PerM